MLRRIDLRGRDLAHVEIPRPRVAGDPPVAAVRAILDAVRTGGDAALRELTARFDGAVVDDLRVPAGACAAALAALPPGLRAAMDTARDNIEAYHRAQLHDGAHTDRGGVHVREIRRPVDRAGCYVPGGQAPLLSTVLMTAVPARVAGVPEVVLCTPPRPDGSVAAELLAAAAVHDRQTVICASHDPEVIRHADEVLALG